MVEVKILITFQISTNMESWNMFPNTQLTIFWTRCDINKEEALSEFIKLYLFLHVIH